IETELTHQNLPYRKYKFTVLKATASKEDILLMKMRDYNAIAKHLKRSQIPIDSTDVYIISRHSPELLDLVSNPFEKQNTITLG
ncbi:ABC transporter permease, partial [Bacillus tropicus]|nr:ABC transporter permease [Bacillus tropicus]